jgi:hypothetical protein
MSNVRWEPRASTGLGPGSLKFNDANALMLRVLAERIDPTTARALSEHMLALHRAITESRSQALTEARQIREIAANLTQKFAAHNFGGEDVRALANGIIRAGIMQHDYTDYAGAEQATMALSSIVAAMKNMNLLNEQQYKTVNSALGKLYDAVDKDEQYKSSTFVAALRDFQQSLPGAEK